jgi:hypothetical protein
MCHTYGHRPRVTCVPTHSDTDIHTVLHVFLVLIMNWWINVACVEVARASRDVRGVRAAGVGVGVGWSGEDDDAVHVA